MIISSRKDGKSLLEALEKAFVLEFYRALFFSVNPNGANDNMSPKDRTGNVFGGKPEIPKT
jgi:hypothetical protein